MQSIDSNLRKVQLLELDVLKKFAKVCDENNLKYFLAEGTLLGAIRHNGFIPWDDDVDVCMPREDFDYFLNNASKILPKELSLRWYKNANEGEKNIMISPQVSDNRHKVKWHYVGPEEVIPLSIDILVLDGLPQKCFKRNIHLLSSTLSKKIVRCSQVNIINKNRRLVWWKKIGILFANILKLYKLNTKKLCIRCDKLERKYMYNDSNIVYSYLSEYGKNTICPKSYYGNGKMVQFEDCILRIPNEAEKILEQEYGDYMKLPPENERCSKHNLTLIS